MTRRDWVVVVALLVACKSKPKPAGESVQPAMISDAASGVDAVREVGESASVLLPDTTPARRLWVSQIPDAATFEAYSKEIGGERFAKAIVSLDSDAIYYFDVGVYPMHKDFIFGELYKKPRTKAAVRLIDRNYSASKPDFMMVYLVHHLERDVWTFAFWDGDLATADHIRRAYKRLRDTFFFGGTLRFRPDSNYQEAVAKRTGDVPYILNDQLYKLAEYQAFNKGVAVGKLRIVPKGVIEADLDFAADEVVVLSASVSDITPVAGIIAEAFSSPLSHVSLRAKGWQIPNVGLRGASTKHADLAGQIVYFEAKDSEYIIRAATDAEILDAKTRREVRKSVTIPEADLSVVELRTLDQMTVADVHTVGPKAANLGVIIAAKLPGLAVPPGFGVPFHYADAHLRAAGIDKALSTLISDPGVAADRALRKQRLAAIRNAIVAAPIDPVLCARVAAGLEALPADTGVFVRSSHNAEDLDAFSGAGLHDTVPNVKGAAAVCDAIKHVWASAWKLTAYDARAHAGIDQSKVAAGVLVQTSVSATAAGVLATVHPTDPTDERNYTINAKSGLGMAVVDGRKIPESLMVSWYNHGVRVLSRSDEATHLVVDSQGGVREVPNPNKNKPVLTNKMAIRLAQVGRRLTKLFKNNKLDIEWVYALDDLYIVQTRPLVGQ